MPRAANGVYTLPAGNPVVTATVISSVWANNTMSDIGTVLSDSLSRSGQGGMTAPLQLADGAIGAPGLSWSNETTSGLYRLSAGVFGYSIAAVLKLQLNANGIQVADGAVGTPGHSFISDPDTGMYRIGANSLGLATAGVVALTIDATQHILHIDGTVGAPAISFASDPDTGVYRGSANFLGLVAGGVRTIGLNATQAFFLDGSVTAPGIAFDSDADTGIYFSVAQGLSFAVNGIQVFRAQSTFVDFNFILTIPDGTVGSPAIQFDSDGDTGIYRAGADNLSFSAGGTYRLSIATTYSEFTNILVVANGTAGAPSFGFNSDVDTGIYRVVSDDLGIVAGGLVIAQFRNVSGAGKLLVVNGTAADPAYAFDNDPDTGIYRISAGRMGFSVNANVPLDLTDLGGGNSAVIIGTSAASTLAINVTTTAGANTGASGAPPAQVAGYMQISVNGTNRKIPYYVN